MTVGPAAAADCGESNGINKADSELSDSDKARCDSWTITNVRGSSETARAVFMVSAQLGKGQLERKRFLCVSVSPASRYGAFRVAGPKQSGRRPGRPADG